MAKNAEKVEEMNSFSPAGVTPKKIGRPPHTPTAETRKYVAMLGAYFVPRTKIAKVLRITVPTLAKYYQRELTTSAARKQLEILTALEKAARAGSVAAMKHLALKFERAGRKR